jgi:hypothetical protein
MQKLSVIKSVLVLLTGTLIFVMAFGNAQAQQPEATPTPRPTQTDLEKKYAPNPPYTVCYPACTELIELAKSAGQLDVVVELTYNPKDYFPELIRHDDSNPTPDAPFDKNRVKFRADVRKNQSNILNALDLSKLEVLKDFNGETSFVILRTNAENIQRLSSRPDVPSIFRLPDVTDYRNISWLTVCAPTCGAVFESLRIWKRVNFELVKRTFLNLYPFTTENIKSYEKELIEIHPKVEKCLRDSQILGFQAYPKQSSLSFVTDVSGFLMVIQCPYAGSIFRISNFIPRSELATSTPVPIKTPDVSATTTPVGIGINTSAATDDLLETVNVRALWNSQGPNSIQGNGITIAVIDSGVDRYHQSLSGNGVIAEEVCFSSEDISESTCSRNSDYPVTGPDAAKPTFYSTNASTIESGWHGTAVSSLAVGRGTATLQGIAPQAQLIAIKANRKYINISGECSINYCLDGHYPSILAGIRYAIDYGVSIINISTGNYTFDCDDTNTQRFKDAVDDAYSKGISVVVTTGNESTNTLIASCGGVRKGGKLRVTLENLRRTLHDPKGNCTPLCRY